MGRINYCIKCPHCTSKVDVRNRLNLSSRFLVSGHVFCKVCNKKMWCRYNPDNKAVDAYKIKDIPEEFKELL